MQLSDKFIALAEYLGLDVNDPEQIEDIDQFEDSMFEYCGDTYKVLTDNELSNEIDSIISDYDRDTQRSINEYEQDVLDFPMGYFMSLSVDYDKIVKEIEDNFPDYVGTGTYEEYDGFYIFLM